MSAPRWEHRRKRTGLQINPTSAYQQVLAAMPPDMARDINNNPLMTIMHGHQAGHTMLAKASEGDINRLLIERNIIDQPVTIEGGGGGVAKNPFFKELWEEKDYGTRNQTIADLKKNDRKQYDYLSGFESAWLEETPVTTPTDLTIGS